MPLSSHWGRATHKRVSKLTIIGRRKAIVWTDAGILLIWILETNFSEIFNKIHTFSLKCISKCRLRNGDNFVSASVC